MRVLTLTLSMLATLNSDAEMLARKLLVKQANSIHARIGSDDAWSTDDDDTFTEFYSAADNSAYGFMSTCVLPSSTTG